MPVRACEQGQAGLRAGRERVRGQQVTVDDRGERPGEIVGGGQVVPAQGLGEAAEGLRGGVDERLPARTCPRPGPDGAAASSAQWWAARRHQYAARSGVWTIAAAGDWEIAPASSGRTRGRP